MRKKKLLSTILAFSLAMSMIPAAMAYDGKTEVEEPEDYGIMLIDKVNDDATDTGGAGSQAGESDGYDTQVEGTKVEVVTGSGDSATTKYYKSFSEALKAINTSEDATEFSIKLYGTITDTDIGDTYSDTNKCGNGRISLLNGKTLTIDLNGHDITLEKSEKSMFYLVNGAKLVLTGTGTISGKQDVVRCAPDSDSVSEHKQSEVKIGNGVTITTTECGVYIFCNANATGDAAKVYTKVTINGKLKSTSTQYANVHVYGTVRDGDVDIIVNEGAEIYGGKASDSADYSTAAMYIAGEADVTVNDGTIEGYSGILSKGGTIEVKKGTIAGAGNPAAVYVGTSGKFGETGDGIAIANESDVYAQGSLKITGGKITSAQKNAVAAYAPTGKTKPTVTITGGWFNTDPRVQGEVKNNTLEYDASGFAFSSSVVKVLKDNSGAVTGYGVKTGDNYLSSDPVVTVTADSSNSIANYTVTIEQLDYTSSGSDKEFAVQVKFGSESAIFYLKPTDEGTFQFNAKAGAEITVINGAPTNSSNVSKYGSAAVTVG